MSVIRYNPSSNLFGLRSEVNNLFDSFFSSSKSEHSLFPVDIYEQENNLMVIAQLPGLEKENVNVEIKNGVLYLSGEYKQPENIKEDSYHIREIKIGRFSRSFSLPSFIDPDKVSASYRKGLLELKIGKLEAVKPKKIEIK